MSPLQRGTKRSRDFPDPISEVLADQAEPEAVWDREGFMLELSSLLAHFSAGGAYSFHALSSAASPVPTALGREMQLS